ncbi:MAG: hypothetical protein NT076_00035 [Candidatus Pacearchaeota archaeon]|nr:hypothetical protein [Candidatus Pacearchaeota archaeon]
MKIISRRFGVYMIMVGIAFQFLNIITYGYWGIDIDIIGALIFIIGVIIMIVGWKRKSKEKKYNKRGRK